MTILEAITARVWRLARPEWSEYAHIELSPRHYHSSVILRDVGPENAEERIPVAALPHDDKWLAWEPPPDVARFLAKWKTYGDLPGSEPT